MSVSKKTLQVLTKLLRETKEGKIDWKRSTSPAGLVRGTDHIVPSFFSATYKEQRLGVYRKRSRGSDEHGPSWDEAVGFCIFAPNGDILWEHEQYSPALASLFEAARESANKVDEVLDSLLQD